MHKYIIGIDTGGTFTDAVLVHSQTGEVLATAKRPTTHSRLSIGTGEALKALLDAAAIAPGDISCLAVSSTLATNSVVENKGARVAVIVIGYVKHFKLPVKAVVFVKGGHDIHGQEEEPLELDYLVTLIEGLQKEVDAYGICSAMSIKNPTHELVAEKAIAMLDPKPVFCSHRISDLAGMEERAATAGLHARLMPIMDEYVDGVNQAMAALGITCPMLVVGGNGKPMEASRAVTHAGLTVASGPACTARFGAMQPERDSLVVDVGGTTTDIAMIAGGQPQLASEGCRIGRWKTHVEAIEMTTAGIGGDSHVHVDEKGKLTIGPRRVTPLATSGLNSPPESWLESGLGSRLICLQQEVAPELAEQDELLAFLMTHKQVTPAQIRRATGLGGVALDSQLERLGREKLLSECGFTPTDALHVLGLLELGDSRAAKSGAEKLAAAMSLSAEDFCRLVVARCEELIENLIIDHIIQKYWKNSLTSFVSSRKEHPVLGVEFSLRLPLIGIGAAARYLLPGVAQRLGTTVSFPQYCEVGNAMGAAGIGREYIFTER